MKQPLETPCRSACLPRAAGRPIDAVRLKAALRAKIYGSLLRLDARAEKARDALMAGDDVAAAAMGHDILARAGTIGRALQHLSERKGKP
jgi:hypothetical protein